MPESESARAAEAIHIRAALDIGDVEPIGFRDRQRQATRVSPGIRFKPDARSVRTVDRRDDLFGFRGPVDRERDAARPRCVFQGTQLLGRGYAGIGERRDMARSGNQLSQQFLPFTVKLGRETRMVCGP